MVEVEKENSLKMMDVDFTLMHWESWGGPFGAGGCLCSTESSGVRAPSCSPLCHPKVWPEEQGGAAIVFVFQAAGWRNMLLCPSARGTLCIVSD